MDTPAKTTPIRATDPWVWAPPVLAIALLAAVQLTGSNTSLFLWFNGLDAFTGDRAWSSITILGDGLVAFMLLLPWMQRRPDVVWAGCLAAILAALWVQGIKPVAALPRPAAVLPAHIFHIIGPTLHRDTFPSGHAATIFALAGVFTLSIASRWLRLLFILSAVAVAASRVAVGAHWPLDVLAGMLGGWLAAALGLWWAGRWSWGLGTWGQRVLFALLLTGDIVLLAGYKTGYPEAVLLQQGIGVAVLVSGLGAATRLFRSQFSR